MDIRDRIDPDSRVPLEELLTEVFPEALTPFPRFVKEESKLESHQTMAKDLLHE